MPGVTSRRQVLTVAATAAVGAASSSAVTAGFTNRVYVARYEISVSTAGGGFKVQLTGSNGRVYEVDLANPEVKEQFMKLLELALGGRGRLVLEIETDDKTIRAFRLEAP